MSRLQVHHGLYVLLMAALCVAIPLSRYMMSMMLIFLAANWLIEGDFKNKWQRLKEQKSAIVAFLFLFVMLLGFIQTDDALTALDYWSCKLPLYLAPVIVASSRPFNRKELFIVLGAFVLSVLFSTIYSSVYYMTHDVVDIREISVFISHIRFSLCVDVAIVLLLYYAFREKKQPAALRIFASVMSAWLLLYLFIAQTLTGIVLLLAVAVIYLGYILACHWKERFYRLTAMGMLCLLSVFVVWVGSVSWQYFHVSEDQCFMVDSLTVNGRLYDKNCSFIVENGSYTGMYVCSEELEQAWAQRSQHSLDEPLLKETLIRYLNSCHLRKDSIGVMNLTEQDVYNIEQGVANVEYTSRFGVKRALYPIFFSIELYRYYGDVQNSTVLQRVEYWRAAWHKIRHNWIFGVGLGNHKTAVGEQLAEDGSSLVGKDRTGCHNQWLTFWLMGGFFVVLYFVLMLIYPFFEQKKNISYVYVAFFIILVGSMFTEDTLETEAGLTLFAIMNSLLLYAFNLNRYENAGIDFKDNCL